ncbi:hypothetical protein [Streptomyces plumbiresistens]|uniref:Antitoxin n=1 Tax=Streptomyces plumbiresistens TaxID=511811 RepID=A0ABP7TQU7_9ACTN
MVEELPSCADIDADAVPFTEARPAAELMARMASGGERTLLSRHGKPVVAPVSIADLQALQATSKGRR